MKNKKLSLNKLDLKKMTISSLQSVKGGYVNPITDPTPTGSTRLTRISDCCVTLMTACC